jgi:hypothetical protein
MSPMLQTKVPGIGMARIHLPEWFWTWNCIIKDFMQIGFISTFLRNKGKDSGLYKSI